MKIGITGRIARASARRPWLTLSAWLVVLVGAIAVAGSVGQYVTSRSVNLVTTEADQAADLDAQHRSVGGEDVYVENVIVTSDTAVLGDPEFDAAVANAVAVLRSFDGVTVTAVPGDDAAAAVAPNGKSAMIAFEAPADEAELKAIFAEIDSAATDTVDVFLFGPESQAVALNKLANEELGRSEGIGLIAALVILVAVFGAVIAAGLPLGIAIVSIITATGLGAAVGKMLAGAGVEVSDSMTVFTGMLGLALGIDYSLLAVQRFREELAKGRTVDEAILATGNTANRAVLFSGATVVVALAGLMIVPNNTFLGIGLGVITVAVAAVAAALTLLPALLCLLGTRVNKWRVPTSHPGRESRFWRGVAGRVARRPALAAAIGMGVLLLSAAPLLGLRFAQPTADAWPDSFVLKRANAALTEDFGWTEATTFVALPGADAAAGERLAAAIEADAGYAGATVDVREGIVFVDAHDEFETATPESKAALSRLRDDVIPAALGDAADAKVGGAQATMVDETKLMVNATPWVVSFILGASFLLLMVLFRSVVIPLKAIILNLFGVFATFGAVVAAYQWGWGAPLGLAELPGISPYLPVMAFALVFGLSMDYHVFLLTRVKERFDATGDNREAVVSGLTRTGPLITGAAAIMVAVFAGFAAAGIPELSQWGFALAFGVLLDATVIRVLLVPAAMVWLGQANWYLPRWLQWLPHLTVEPEPEFTPASAATPAVPTLAR